MATATAADFSYIAKQIYPKGFDPKSLVRDKPALANTPHRKDFTSSEGMKIPAPYGLPQGASAAVATAATNATASKGSAFIVPQVKYYVQLRIEQLLVRNAMQGNADAHFVDQFKYDMDNCMETMGVELNKQLFGTAAGYRGVIGSVSIGANTTVTLSNISDAQLFEVGMVIVLATTATGAIRSGGTTNKATVSAVNTKTGVLTFTGQNFTTLFGTAAQGDFIFREGDAQNNASTPVCAFGLSDWNPATDPTSTLFCGVDRSVQPSRLAGVRYDGSLDSIQNVFIKALAQARSEVGPGFKKGVFYLHPLNAAALRSSVESKRIVSLKKETTYEIGVDAFEIDGITFVEDALCPFGVSKMVADGAFLRATSGDAPFWAHEGTGNEFWIDRGTDTVCALVCHYGNFVAMKPNQLLHVTLPSI